MRRRRQLRFLHLAPCTLYLAALLLSAATALAQSPLDTDRDGLSDELEQTLLERFHPTFMISADDCATRPARFQPETSKPTPIAKDGTIYGQVFPVPNSERVEIHYYTLWEKDCGRLGHPLDTEHVSVLLARNPEWKALYWYAGAHEKTVCDISSGARADAIDAVNRGPTVWSASGKHALYLRQFMCGHGCGGDSCNDNRELSADAPVINLGEPGAPANGAVWIASGNWPLSEKMGTDFPPAVLARLDATSGDTVLTLAVNNVSARGAIQGGDAALDGAAIGAQQTGAALDTANTQTGKSLGTAIKATGRSLKKAWKAVFGPRAQKPSQPES